MKFIQPSFFYPVFWLVISTVLLTLPGSAFPTENWLSKIWFDKWVHVGMFAALVTLWCWAIHKKKIPGSKLKFNFFLIVIFCLLYGVGMEFIQEYFIFNRSFEVGDIVADAIGSAVGYLFALKKLIKKN